MFIQIKEPINSISSLCMVLYTNSIIDYNKLYLISNGIKIIIILNLCCSIIYHSTYNLSALLLDKFTMILPFIYIFIYYKYYLFLIILIILYSLFDSTISFIFSFSIFLFIKNKEIINYIEFNNGIILCICASLFWFFDLIFNKYQYLCGHAL